MRGTAVPSPKNSLKMVRWTVSPMRHASLCHMTSVETGGRFRWQGQLGVHRDRGTEGKGDRWDGGTGGRQVGDRWGASGRIGGGYR